MGTTADVVGSVLRCGALAPVSVVAGAVGATSGMIQLRKGLTAPSGVTDPHLVTKGSFAAALGTSSVALGVAAAAAPVLFFVALGLSVCSVTIATTLDATMNGLCAECRENIPLDLATEFECCSEDDNS